MEQKKAHPSTEDRQSRLGFIRKALPPRREPEFVAPNRAERRAGRKRRRAQAR